MKKREKNNFALFFRKKQSKNAEAWLKMDGGVNFYKIPGCRRRPHNQTNNV